MSAEGSVTVWIRKVKAGDREAAHQLWDRYFARLVVQARKQLDKHPHGLADDEDIALSAFVNFYRRAIDQALPEFMNREDLWELFLGILAWKARDAGRKECRAKRGGGRVHDESRLERLDRDGREQRGLEQLPDPSPNPAEQLLLAEAVEHFLQLLGDQAGTLRPVAEWKLEGWTNQEIATKLHCSLGTVERKLAKIRTIWRLEVQDERTGSPSD